MWFKRKENEDVTLSAEVKSLKARLTRVEAEILDIGTAQDIIRNKVLRKIQTRKAPEEEEDSYQGIPKSL